MMRPDRLLFPATGFTKNDALRYYQGAASVLLPHLKNVPVSFKRYPDTVDGESFWEKDAPAFTPKWVKTVAVPRRAGGADIRYIVIDDLRTLAWLVDAGGIEIHPFLHRAPRLEVATSVVFDLDPGAGTSFADCCRVAVMLRDLLLHVKLKSFAKVSGSKGLQMYVPLNSPGITHEATETFARVVAGELARAAPELIVAEMAKHLRTGRVFIDWSQNADYKTTISVYSLRATRERPCVSMPVTWEEIERGHLLEFSPEEALQRLRHDLFAPVLQLKQKLPIDVPRAARPPRPLASARGDRKRSQSGRREFVVKGNELWLESKGHFALSASLADERGTYELIEGSDAQHRFDLWFTGRALNGEWILQKTDAGSWELARPGRGGRPRPPARR